MLVQGVEVLHHQDVDDLAVFLQPGQVREVDVPQLTILEQPYKEPKGHDLAAVVEQAAHDEVHSLDVVHLLVIVCESNQGVPQLPVERTVLLEQRVLREGAAQVSVDLVFCLGFGLDVDQGLTR